MKTILVAGAGGFVGGYLVGALLNQGHRVRAVSSRDVSQWLQKHNGATNEGCLDLRDSRVCEYAVSGCDEVYNLAAKVGGVDYIQSNRVSCSLSSLINTHLLLSSEKFGISKYFYASSACVYPSLEGMISEDMVEPFRGTDGYGLEKYFGEKMCQHFMEEKRVSTRVGRFFTTYGPGDNVKDDEGRSHVPSALCKKVLEAKRDGKNWIKIWGDGTQRRNFLYVSDAAEGAIRLMDSDFHMPVNVGGSEVVTINELLDLIEGYSGTKLKRLYDTKAVTGVRSRGSDNTLILDVLGWAPYTPLREGIKLTFEAMKERI